MRGLWGLAAILYLCLSCKNTRVEKPEGLLKEDQVATVLTEIELLDAVYTLEYQKRDTSRKSMSSHYEEVFTRHAVSREQFEKSLEWYGQDPERIRVIRYKVYDGLSKMQAERRSEAQRDSLLQTRRDSTVK